MDSKTGNLALQKFAKAAGITGQHIVHNVMFDNTNFPWSKQWLPTVI